MLFQSWEHHPNDLTKLIYPLVAPSPDTIALELKPSTYEFWGDMEHLVINIILHW